MSNIKWGGAGQNPFKSDSLWPVFKKFIKDFLLYFKACWVNTLMYIIISFKKIKKVVNLPLFSQLILIIIRPSPIRPFTPRSVNNPLKYNPILDPLDRPAH